MFTPAPVVTPTVRNNAHVHTLAAIKACVATVPFAVNGLVFDNGSEVLNHDVVEWASESPWVLFLVFYEGTGWSPRLL